MKTLMVLLLLINPETQASSPISEGPLLTLQKVATTALVMNYDTKIPLAEALAMALQHEEKERIQIVENCNLGPETFLETCQVTFSKRLKATVQGLCGEFTKGSYYFRFTRKKTENSFPQIQGDIDLEITRR